MWAPAGDLSNRNPTCWNGSAKRRSRPFSRLDTSCPGERRSTASCAAPTRRSGADQATPLVPHPREAKLPTSPSAAIPEVPDWGRRTGAQMSVRVFKSDPLRSRRVGMPRAAGREGRGSAYRLVLHVGRSCIEARAASQCAGTVDLSRTWRRKHPWLGCGGSPSPSRRVESGPPAGHV